MTVAQRYLTCAALLLCCVGIAAGQRDADTQKTNLAYDELGRLLKALGSDQPGTRKSAEKQLHQCCELLTRTLVERASLYPEKTLLGQIEGRSSDRLNKNEQDAAPALAMRLLGDLRTTYGIRDRLKEIDYVCTLSSYTTVDEAGLEWLMPRPAAYSIFMLGRASTPEIVSYLYGAQPEDVSQQQIDLLARLIVSSHGNPIAALRVVRGTSAQIHAANLRPPEITTNIRRLDDALAALARARE